ncbi:MAG: type I methionyl aminopeptidase [Pirellulaceae bacterium]|nr:type I methionyl aminopeptidase [Pirellulaceae bacterium]
MTAAGTRPITYKSAREISKMREAGLIVWLAHQRVATMIGPGVSTAEINRQIQLTFQEHLATPLFLNYPPDSPQPFPAETCISLNEQVVHGIPNNRRLKSGDIVKVDTGCSIAGWCGDAAVTHAIGSIPANVQNLLEVTRSALNVAISALQECTQWSEVSQRIEACVRPHRFGIVESLVGHGIGRKLHEAPDVPNYYDPEWKNDFLIRPGLVLAIEPMINLGTKEVHESRDGWTIVSRDRSYSAHFEHTVAITEDGPQRLTCEPTESEWNSRSWPDWLPPRERWFRW